MSDELQREVERLRQRVSELELEILGHPGRSLPLGELRRLLEVAPDSITLLDPSGTILYLNRTISPRRIEDVLGTNALDYLPIEHREPFRAALFECVRSAELQRVVVATIRNVWYETRLVPVLADGAVKHVMGIGSDVTHRYRVERSVRESEAKLRLAIGATGMGVWSWSCAEDCISWDERAQQIHGVGPEGVPRGLDEFLALVEVEDRERVRESIMRAVSTGRYDDFEFRLLQPDGKLSWILAKGEVFRDEHGRTVDMIGGVFDVTDRKQLEERLRHAQRMEAFGQLTAGIAHNFNNLLTVILPNLELVRARVSPQVLPLMDDVAMAAQRAADLVRQLMLLARRWPGTTLEPIDLGASVGRAVQMCRATFDRRMRILLERPAGTLTVAGMSSQLEQALLNLLLNARDALSNVEAEHPEIRVRVEPFEHEGVPGFRIEVEDNGCGMDAATRARALEPFFTTKGPGRGTGLGLSTADAIVAEHHGRFEIASELGVGTTLSIWLPKLSGQTNAESALDVAEVAPGGNETVLLVDDETIVRRALTALLEYHGYQVIQAADGIDGLERLRDAGARVDLAIIDVSMPRLSGIEMLAQARCLYPNLPVVMLSGNQVPPLLPVSAVLQKPVRSSELLSVVRRALDAPSRPGV